MIGNLPRTNPSQVFSPFDKGLHGVKLNMDDGYIDVVKPADKDENIIPQLRTMGRTTMFPKYK